MSDGPKSRIDELNDSLYSRSAPSVQNLAKHRSEDIASEVRTDWNNEAPVLPVEKPKPQSYMSFLSKLLIFSILFCIAAVSIGVYLFLNGANLISADNIEITLNGPVSIPGGTPVSYDIAVTNNNTVTLEGVELSVTFPPGATSPGNRSQPLSNFREIIGDISPKQAVHRTVQAVIFGEQNTQKTLVADVTYRVKGSSSSFTKEKTHDVLINSSPVTLTVSSFKEITAGQDFDLNVDIKSNSADPLHNVLLSATYPFGYNFMYSSLTPAPDKSTWRLGDLPAGGSKRITIHGKLQGEDQDTRVFHFAIGAESPRNPNVIGTEYIEVSQEVAVSKSFMTIGLAVDGNQGDNAIGHFNQPVHVEISWYNNLPTAVSDAEISIKMSGSAYDRTLVQPGVGYYRSSTDEIIWNSQTTPKLQNIPSHDSGTVSFDITPRDLGVAGRGVVNPSVTLAVSVRGRRAQESGVPQSLSSIANKTIKIGTVASLSGSLVRATGPFTNTGPIPPHSDQKTTYTVIWSIDNTANSISNAVVTAVLPPFVKWTNQISPQNEDITYDQKTGTVTWKAGAVGAYTAMKGSRKTAAFQIAFEPSVAQVQSIPTLVNEATLTATDDFTGATLTNRQSYLTTRFSTDPTFKIGDEVVR